MPVTFCNPFEPSHTDTSYGATVCAPLERPIATASVVWSPCPCVIRIRSSAPSFFADSGDFGLPVTQGSNRIFFPPGDCRRNVAWPSQVMARDIGGRGYQ